MNLYLIRHGETAWTLSGQHTGRTDIPLTPQGEHEARALGAELTAVRFNRVFTSPRQRATRTCELVGLDAVATIEPDLAEWDYGDYEGRRSDEIRAQRPEWNLFQDGCPNGEMPESVSARADRVVALIRMLHGNVAVFSHGHFGRVLVARWIGLPVSGARHFLLGTSSLSILRDEPHGPDEPAILLWNAVPASTADPGPHLRLDGVGPTADTSAIERWDNEGGESGVHGKRRPDRLE